jgi:putative membrane protein
MNGWYGSMGAGDWLLVSVFWVALIALVAWVIARLAADGNRGEEDLRERPEEILDRRLASGEIDAATYDALRGTLREAHTGKA